MDPTKFLLAEKDIPSVWYNIQADLPERLKPVLHPGTGKPIGPADLAPLFPIISWVTPLSRFDSGLSVWPGCQSGHPPALPVL